MHVGKRQRSAIGLRRCAHDLSDERLHSWPSAGAAITGALCAHAFRLINNVEAYQVIQRRPGHAIVRIVRGQGFDASAEEPKVHDIFRKYLGHDADIQIEYVDAVAKTPAGKARFVINEISAPAPMGWR